MPTLRASVNANSNNTWVQITSDTTTYNTPQNIQLTCIAGVDIVVGAANSAAALSAHNSGLSYYAGPYTTQTFVNTLPTDFWVRANGASSTTVSIKWGC